MKLNDRLMKLAIELYEDTHQNLSDEYDYSSTSAIRIR